MDEQLGIQSIFSWIKLVEQRLMILHTEGRAKSETNGFVGGTHGA